MAPDRPWSSLGTNVSGGKIPIFGSGGKTPPWAPHLEKAEFFTYFQVDHALGRGGGLLNSGGHPLIRGGLLNSGSRTMKRFRVMNIDISVTIIELGVS